MTPDTWNRVKELFEAALELDSAQRAAFLAENCREESLRQQVEKLLMRLSRSRQLSGCSGVEPQCSGTKRLRPDSEGRSVPLKPAIGGVSGHIHKLRNQKIPWSGANSEPISW